MKYAKLQGGCERMGTIVLCDDMLNQQTELVLPSLPMRVPPPGFSLRVRSTFDLPEERAALLRDMLASSESRHLSIRKQIMLGESEGELRGVIGVHIRKDADLDLFSSDMRPGSVWIHTSFEINGGLTVRERKSDDWERFAEFLMGDGESRLFTVSSLWGLPLEQVTFAVALPIPLAVGAIPGFKEIRGVRLSQPDPSSPEEDLYSLILNQAGAVASVQVQASVEAVFNHELLVVAFERALSIADLAIDFEGDA